METPVEQAAWRARMSAYAPYSHYRVGCAIELVDGSIVTGANIENSSYGLTICAERVALFKQIVSRQSAIKCLVFATETPDKHFSPCGACLQVMLEFMNLETPVGHYNGRDTKFWKLNELLPLASAKILG